MIDPVPWQFVQGSENANEPWFRVVNPVPLHTGQSRGDVPGFAPTPWQVGQVVRSVMPSGTVTPVTASLNAIRTSVSRSAPRTARGRALDWPLVRLNRPPKRSPKPPAPPAPPAPALRKMSLMSKPPAPAPGPAPAPPPGKPRKAPEDIRLRASS